MAPLEKGDDGFGEQYTSMFSSAANGKKVSMPTIMSESNLHTLNHSKFRRIG